MEIGLSSGAFPANMSIPQGLKLAKRSGFDCVELEISEAGYLTLESDAQAVGFLRRSVENMSLSVGCVRADVLADLPVGSCEYLAAAHRCVEIAQELGCRGVAVPLHDHGVSGVLEGLAGVLRDFCGCEDSGVNVAIECGSGGLLTLIEEAGVFIDKIGCAGIGICVDTGNVGAIGPPEQWIRVLGDRVKMVRARDYRLSSCGKLEYVNLLEGDVDWKEVRRALLDIGYGGEVIAKTPGYRHYAELGVRHCGDAMKRIFGPAAKRQE